MKCDFSWPSGFVLNKKAFKVIQHIWAWPPYLSCDLNCLVMSLPTTAGAQGLK